MRILLRILPFVVLIWLICNFFYSLGKKRAFNQQKHKDGSPSKKRKHVDSTVIEDDSN